MKTLKAIATGLAVVGLVSVTNVRASFVSIGDPVVVGSWSQGWTESGVGAFTQIEYIMVTAGVTFDNPAFNSFNQVGWANVPYSSTLAVAAGPSVTTLTYNNVVSPSVSTPFIMDLYAWNGMTAVDAAQASWSGTAWTITALGLNTAPTPVPEATTVLAGALLLLPFGASAFRILRKNRIA